MQSNEILGLHASAVGLEVIYKCLGRDAVVEGGSMLKILVVGLVDTVTDELGSTFLGGNIRVVIL